MKWKSKVTGITFNVFDVFTNDNKHQIAIFAEEDSFDSQRPLARLSYVDFLESFERVG